jgi:hypothetical protein
MFMVVLAFSLALTLGFCLKLAMFVGNDNGRSCSHRSLLFQLLIIMILLLNKGRMEMAEGYADFDELRLAFEKTALFSRKLH